MNRALKPAVIVKNISGYRFICEKNVFICDRLCGRYEVNPGILYDIFHGLLDEDRYRNNSGFMRT